MSYLKRSLESLFRLVCIATGHQASSDNKRSVCDSLFPTTRFRCR